MAEKPTDDAREGKEGKVKFAKLYEPVAEPGGGFSVEEYHGDEPAPLNAPGGPRTTWTSEADMLATLEQDEAALGPLLSRIKLAKHLRANNLKADSGLVARINADPLAQADLTSQSATISV